MEAIPPRRLYKPGNNGRHYASEDLAAEAVTGAARLSEHKVAPVLGWAV